MASQVQYYDGAINTTKTGYIIDGKTYEDPNGTERVSDGSIVNTNGGLYIKTPYGSMKLSDYESMQSNGRQGMSHNYGSGDDSVSENYINDLYNAKYEAEKIALESAYNENVSNINAAKQTIPAEYQRANNDVSSQTELRKGNFNEYAAASGLNNGAGGQATLAFNNTLQANLGGLNMAQAAAVSDLDRESANLGVQYQNDLAQAFAEGNFKKISALYNDYAENKRYAQAEAQRKASQNVDIMTFDEARSQAAYERAVETAQMTGIYSGMAAYGWTSKQIAQAEALWDKEFGL